MEQGGTVRIWSDYLIQAEHYLVEHESLRRSPKMQKTYWQQKVQYKAVFLAMRLLCAARCRPADIPQTNYPVAWNSTATAIFQNGKPVCPFGSAIVD